MLLLQIESFDMEQSFVFVVNVGFLISHLSVLHDVDYVFLSQEPSHETSEGLFHFNFFFFFRGEQ